MAAIDLTIESIQIEAEVAVMEARVSELLGRHVSDDGIETLMRDRVRRGTRRGAAGQALLQKLSPASRKRFFTARVLERALFDEDEGAVDFAPLVFIGCQLIEEHLCRLLLPCSRNEAARLRAALSKNPGLVAVFDSWIGGRLHATLGTLQMLLVAHRRLIGEGQHPLAGPMSEEYLQILMTKGIEKGIGRIRDDYRNPAAHGSATFDARAYGQFLDLLVGSRSLEAWDEGGPTPQLPLPDRATLHHHLVHWRGD